MRRGACWIAFVVASGCAAAMEPPSPPQRPAAEPGQTVAQPTDESARRSVIAKLGRLAWSDVGQPLAFCDLDGGDVVTSDAGPVVYVRWLPDGRRVVANRNGRVLVVDAVTGKSTDLAPDEPAASFFGPPKLSPNRRFGVWWRKERRGRDQRLATAAYTVFDLDGATHCDIGPVDWPSFASYSMDSQSAFWWSPRGELFADVSAPRPDSEPPGTRWRLVRWSPGDRSTATIAELPRGTRVADIAFRGECFAYIVTPETDDAFAPAVRADNGSTLFELTEPGALWSLGWEDDGAALRVRVQPPEGPPSYTLRVEPGRAAERVPDHEPWPRAPLDDGWIEQQRIGEPDKYISTRQHPESEVWRVFANGEATKIGLGNGPRRVGDVVVFWSVTVSTGDAQGPAFEMPNPIPGTDDLWAYDPRDGATIRLTTRGFCARCWDIRITPTRDMR